MSIDSMDSVSLVSILSTHGMALTSERTVIGFCELIANVALEAIHYVEEGEECDLAQFDAHSGNYGCEAVAYRVLTAVQKGGFQGYKAVFAALKEALTARREQKAGKMPFKAFFNKFVGTLQVSSEFASLLQARVLTITKTRVVDEAGYETEKTEHDNLLEVAQTLDPAIRARMVASLQEELSRSTVKFLGASIAELTYVSSAEKKLMQTMFEEANLFLYTGKLGKHARPKTYCSAYYAVKVLLLQARHRLTPLVIKKLVKVGESQQAGLCYRAKNAGGAFERCSPEEIRTHEPVFVCEGIIPDSLSMEALAEKIERFSLSNILLANAAQGSQYVPGHAELKKVEVPDAQKEIAEQILKAQEVESHLDDTPIFNLMHVMCQTFEKERRFCI